MYPHKRIIGRLSVTAVACFVMLGHVQASIYRCTNGKDPVLFSQFACPQGATATLWESSDTTLFVLPPLTKAEQDELAAMARANARKEKARQSQRRRQEKLRNAAAAKTRQQCREARTALATIRLQKKQGYKASAARALDREQARWDAVRKTTC